MSHHREKVMIIVTAAITARLFMRGYAEHLADSGYEVTLIADDVSEIAGELAARGVSTHSLPMRREPSPVQDLLSMFRMVHLMRRIRPDAVIYATPKASLLGSAAARLLRVPVRIYELWGIRFETATGLARSVFTAIERFIARSSTAVIANSRSLAQQASRLGIVRDDRIEVPGSGSSHGVDAERFSIEAPRPFLDAATASFLEQHPGMTIGFVGRLHPDKGVDVLLSAAQRLRSTGDAIRVVLVGSAEGIDVPTGGGVPVHRTGETDDVRPYLAEFDVLVLMSLREGFPNVVLEAGAMQVPAIVSNATGCVDSVVDGVTGIVVPIGEVDRLVEALKALRDPDRTRSMGEAARQWVLGDFDPHQVWSLLEGHLRKQLDAVTGFSERGVVVE